MLCHGISLHATNPNTNKQNHVMTHTNPTSNPSNAAIRPAFAPTIPLIFLYPRTPSSSRFPRSRSVSISYKYLSLQKFV
jgi:hypothetical protein